MEEQISSISGNHRSGGNPTEVDVLLEGGGPAGWRCRPGFDRRFEAIELRDNDEKRFLGKGVLTAVQNVNETPAVLLGLNVEQQELDRCDRLRRLPERRPPRGQCHPGRIAGLRLRRRGHAKPALYRYLGR